MARFKRPIVQVPVYCICRGPSSGDMIECSVCREWFHAACVKLTSEGFTFFSQPDSVYYCPACLKDQVQEEPSESDTEPVASKRSIEESSVSSTSASKRSRRQDRQKNAAQDDGQDFDVTRIVQHRFFGEEREFLLEWAGYADLEWTDERNMVGCKDLLVAYCKEKGLEETKIEGVCGAAMEVGIYYNTNNFVEMPEILHQVEAYSRHKREPSPLEVTIFREQKPLQDVIQLIAISSHCVVALCLPSRGIAYAADGTNEVYNDPSYRAKVEALLGLPVKPLRFHQQKCVDHCASSAAAMAIEFRRLYKDLSQISEDISVKPWALSEIRRNLHKEESVVIPKGWNSIANVAFPKCPKCGKEFKGGRQKMVTHMRFCKGVTSDN